MIKKNIILAIILVLLVGMFYVYENPFQSWRAKQNKPQNFLAGIKAEQLNKVIISKNGNLFTLAKEGDSWKIVDSKFLPDNNLITGMIKSLNTLRQADLELVSIKADKKKELKVDSQGGLNYTLNFNTGSPLSFALAESQSYQNFYISEANSNNTYAVKADLYGLQQDDWYDKTIFAFDQTQANKIRLQYPGKQILLEKDKSNKWHNAVDQKEMRAEQIDKVLNTAAQLSAIKIPKQDFKGTGLEKHLVIAEISGTGFSHTLMIGDKSAEGFFYAKKGDSDNIYLISDEQRKAFVF